VHPGGLQNIEKPHQIALHVGLWVADAVPDVSLGTQVHHVIRANLRPKALESARFSEIELHEPEIIQPLKLRKPGTLEVHGVVVAQVIDAHHLTPAGLGKASGDVVADESGGSGNKDLHGLSRLQPFDEVVNFRLPQEK
jgi:hypothetical protein